MVSTTMQRPRTALKAPTVEPWVPVQAPVEARQQAPAPHANWTVLENVIEPIAAAGATPTLAFEVATDALDLLDLSRLAGTPFQDLSTSQQQRVMIARTMATQPALGFGEWVEAMERLDGFVATAA